jgi:hypothetical protein
VANLHNDFDNLLASRSREKQNILDECLRKFMTLETKAHLEKDLETMAKLVI